MSCIVKEDVVIANSEFEVEVEAVNVVVVGGSMEKEDVVIANSELEVKEEALDVVVVVV